MNMSHVITELSFCKHFPEITQPLNNPFEVTHDKFIAYQFYLRVVPTTYVTPRTQPLHTDQYTSHYVTNDSTTAFGRPRNLSQIWRRARPSHLIQRTTTFAQFFIRCVGIIGGIRLRILGPLRNRLHDIRHRRPRPRKRHRAPDSARSGGPRSKWTSGGALQATHRYSPVSGSRPDPLQRRLKLYEPRRLSDAPVLALLAHLGAAAALWPHAFWPYWQRRGLGSPLAYSHLEVSLVVVGRARRRRWLR
ncbi:hypothetical protein V8E53_008856 [Lactarius tabidus]